MIPRSRAVAAMALLAAAAAHAGYAVLQDRPAVELAGGQTGLAAAGSSFANLAEGLQEPETAQPAEQAPVPPVRMASHTPQADAAGAPVRPALTSPVPVTVPAASDAPAVAPVPQPDGPAEPAAVDPAPPPKLQEPVKPESKLVQPVAEQPEVQPPEPEPKPRPKPVKPQGNSTAGASRGTAEGMAKVPGGEAVKNPGKARVQGNAAADNYRGQVLRRVQRARRKSTRIRGQAVVVFTIAPGGALSALRIGRSSGHARLDAIALAQIRRAAPFPPPPPGAPATYKITIKGR